MEGLGARTHPRTHALMHARTYASIRRMDAEASFFMGPCFVINRATLGGLAVHGPEQFDSALDPMASIHCTSAPVCCLPSHALPLQRVPRMGCDSVEWPYLIHQIWPRHAKVNASRQANKPTSGLKCCWQSGRRGCWLKAEGQERSASKRQKGSGNAAETRKRAIAFLRHFWSEIRVSAGNTPETRRKDPPKLSDVLLA